MLRLMTRSSWQMSFKALAWAMVLGNPAEATGQRHQQTSWQELLLSKLWTKSLRIKVLRLLCTFNQALCSVSNDWLIQIWTIKNGPNAAWEVQKYTLHNLSQRVWKIMPVTALNIFFWTCNLTSWRVSCSHVSLFHSCNLAILKILSEVTCY